MDTLPLKHTKWSNRLAFDVALLLEKSGETLDEVIERHSITASDMLVFNEDPIFRMKVDDYREEVREKGITFRLKARAQAEELLTTSWQLIHSPEVSPAVKADLIKSTVKWGNLEPKNNVAEVDAGGGVKVTINLGSISQPHEATVIEHDASTDDSDQQIGEVPNGVSDAEITTTGEASP